MNLHGVVRGAIGAVNPHVMADIYVSSGFSTGPSGKREPTFGTHLSRKVQKQAVTQADLRHLDNLNVQGATTKIWTDGAYWGDNRQQQSGGDLIFIAGQCWLVVAVMEIWPDWCSVIGNLQLDATPPTVTP